MKRRILSILPTILFLGLLTALVSVRSATSAQSIHSMAVEPGYLAQARLSIKCNTLIEDLSGSFPTQTFPGTVIQQIDRPAEVFVRNRTEVKAFWIEKAQQTICIFVCASLPRSMGLCEINRGVEVFFYLVE